MNGIAEKTCMVYCTKCGNKNPDDAKICSQCGASLYSIGEPTRQRRRDDECFGTQSRREPYKRVENECFGIPRGGVIVGIVIGLIIILFGTSMLLEAIFPDIPSIPWWPFIIIIFGLLLIIGAIYRMRRRP
jgi:hypothetical protein